MAKQIKIKDIAELAGVSAGTVDRVLHKRGNVSRERREAVEKILAEVGYKYNIHTSAVSFRKVIKITIVIPEAPDGEYWGSMREGFEHALEEFSDIRIECKFLFYDQFDVNSCNRAYSALIESQPDSVIIGPTYIDETKEICDKLDLYNIPYIFVDSVVEDTCPLATFSTDQYACGFLSAKVLDMSMVEDSSIAILEAERTGNRTSSNSLERRKGFEDYMKSVGKSLYFARYATNDKDENRQKILGFLENHENIKGIAVLNSRGHLIADILKEAGREDIKVISFDMTTNNIRCLKENTISALLCQRPEQQGFNAIKTLLDHLLFRNVDTNTRHMMPIDVIFKENLPYYSEIIKH